MSEVDPVGEPVKVEANVRAVVLAVAAALSAFGAWEPSPGQLAAVLGLWVAVTAASARWWVRARVTPWRPPSARTAPDAAPPPSSPPAA